MVPGYCFSSIPPPILPPRQHPHPRPLALCRKIPSYGFAPLLSRPAPLPPRHPARGPFRLNAASDATDATTGRGPIIGGGRWRGLLVGATAGLAMYLAALDFSVNVALPEMAAALSADLQSVQWALVVFICVRGSLVLGAGSFADRFGLRRVYLWGGLAYLISMFCIALAPDLATVVGFRVLHGIGTACLYAVAPAITANLFPGHRRGLGMGFAAASQALGMVGGTLGAGLLVGGLGWEWVFWGRVPFMAAALLLAWLFLERDPPAARGGPAFDLAGALTLAGGLICVIIGLRLGRDAGWTSAPVLAMLLLAPALLAAFWRAERRAAWPVLPLALLRRRGFVISGACVFLLYFGAFVVWFIFPFYVADALGHGPEVLGAMLAAASLAGTGFSLLGGWLSDRAGARIVGIAGMLLLSAGLFLMGTLDAASSIVWAGIWVTAVGSANGLIQAAGFAMVMRSVPPERFGTAGAMLSLTQALGSVLGVAIFGALFALRSDHHLTTLSTAPNAETAAFILAYRDVFTLGAAVALAGVIAAAMGRGRE